MGGILVTGGAGYIGSVTAHALVRAGREVSVVDNLELGHLPAVPKGARFFEADLRDIAQVEALLAEARPDAIVHFAAYSQVGQSVQQPGRYRANIVASSGNLLGAASKLSVGRVFVLSSTAATYGNPEGDLVEEHPQNPINPYGACKLEVESMLRKGAAGPSNLRAIALRYFNAAGASMDGQIGEHHSPETHLIPLALGAAAGTRPALKVFGRDYSTLDGTCVRDYIHVDDLAEAHIRAVEHLEALPEGAGHFDAFNVGTGTGNSVLEVISAVQHVTGSSVPHSFVERRAGDPAVLVANADKLKRTTGWAPTRSSLRTIVEDAHRWHASHPNGYEGSERI